MPTTSQGVNPNANIPVDPLQTQDPWRNFQTPSQEEGIPDQPFSVSMPTSPDRQQPFGATSSNAQAASPPQPGLPVCWEVGRRMHQSIPQRVLNRVRETNMKKIPSRVVSVGAAEITGFIDWLSALAS